MPTIDESRIRYFNGAEARITRLGLKSLWDELVWHHHEI